MLKDAYRRTVGDCNTKNSVVISMMLSIRSPEGAMNLEIERVRVVVFPDGRLDTDNAARYLGLSNKTLAMMRSSGSGPRFVKRGRVFYFLEDLQAWLAEQPRVQSTAQARLRADEDRQAPSSRRPHSAAEPQQRGRSRPRKARKSGAVAP
jgi:Helix-turn-helix domain